MDEAERCHKLAYILNGQLLAQGTADEVVASQKLVGWAVEGPDLMALANELRALPACEQVAAFGDRLHVIGRDKARLDADLSPFRADPRYHWEVVEPGLEDVFIHLMRTAKKDKDEDVACWRRSTARPSGSRLPMWAAAPTVFGRSPDERRS